MPNAENVRGSSRNLKVINIILLKFESHKHNSNSDCIGLHEIVIVIKSIYILKNPYLLQFETMKKSL